MKCSWAQGKYIDTYHDTEHGKMKYSNIDLFELLTLEIMQPGLSFQIVLSKREGLKSYFLNYDLEHISKMTDDDVLLGLENSNIIRHRLKIESIIHNAQIIKKKNLNLKDYIYKHIDYRQGLDKTGILLSKQMKKDGFKFIGPSVASSFLEALGLLPAHSNDCFMAINGEHTVVVNTPLDPLVITYSNFQVTSSRFDECAIPSHKLNSFEQYIKNCVEQYFLGTLKQFKINLDTSGTQFQQYVWDAIRQIPYGNTMTYKQVANNIASQGYRAVGNAANKCNYALFIPAHRLVSSKGIGGFGNKLEYKQYLITHEKDNS